MKHLKFIDHMGSYQSGDTASFPDAEADLIIKKKKAVEAPLHEKHKGQTDLRIKHLTEQLAKLSEEAPSEEAFLASTEAHRAELELLKKLVAKAAQPAPELTEEQGKAALTSEVQPLELGPDGTVTEKTEPATEKKSKGK